jgi:hypothetical protein
MTTDRTTVPIFLPGPAERATLDAGLRASGAESGFWDERGTPAPWPEDIDDWRPVNNPPRTAVVPGRPTFEPTQLEDQPNTTPRDLTRPPRPGGVLRVSSSNASPP